jgi:outer membrane protein assembly factor BamB
VFISIQAALAAAASALAAVTPANPGFESPAISGTVEYTPAGAGWTFAGQAGLAKEGGLSAPAPHGGSQSAFLQGSPGNTLGSMSQSITFPAAGSYTLSMRITQRPADSVVQLVRLSIDGTAESMMLPGSFAVYGKVTSAAFRINAAGAHTVRLEALRGTSNSVCFIDDITIQEQFTGTPAVIDTTGQPSGAWTQSMGPEGSGVAAATGLANSYPNQKPPVLWQANAGFGTAPVAVSGGVAYTFGLYKPGTTLANIADPSRTPTLEEVKQGTFDAKDVPGIPPTYYPSTPAGITNGNGYPANAYRGDEYATAWNTATGQLLWAAKLTDYGIAFGWFHQGFAGSSPLVVGSRVYIYNNQCQLYCLDTATGERVWPEPVTMWASGMWAWVIGQDAQVCSPILAGNAIIVAFTGSTNPDYTSWGGWQRIVAAFDATTGAQLWVRKAPRGGAFYNPARVSQATIEGRQTVLLNYGGGVMGVDPANGASLWSFDTPFWNYNGRSQNWDLFAPVVWNDHVVVANYTGHDDFDCGVFCYKIEGGSPKFVWSTQSFCPNGHLERNNMVAWDGKVYGFDSHGGTWDAAGFSSFNRQAGGSTGPEGRNYRGDECGRFQCWDIATGTMLWSTSAFDPQRDDLLFNPFILAGDRIIATDRNGLWVGQVSDAGVNIQVRMGGTAPYIDRKLGEPVLDGGRLFIRQVDADRTKGFIGTMTEQQGNLTVFELRPEGSTPSAPIFNEHPRGVTTVPGGSATFTVNVYGNPEPTITWYRDGQLIDNASGWTYTLSNVQIADSGARFVARATNSEGTLDSHAAALTVLQPQAPSFTTHPQDVTVLSGSGAAFTVAATGNPAPAISWYRDGQLIEGEVRNTYTLASAGVADNGAVFVARATNSVGSVDSNPATLSVTAGGSEVVITFDGIPSANNYDGTLFAAAGTWSTALGGFQFRTEVSPLATTGLYGGSVGLFKPAWQAPLIQMRRQDGAPFMLKSFSMRTVSWSSCAATVKGFDASGAELFSETFGPTTTALTCTVAHGTTAVARIEWTYPLNPQDPPLFDDITLSVPPPPPVISTQPASASIDAGGQMTLSVAATGEGTLVYQWKRNGVTIPGATAPALTLPSTQAFHAGSYTCVVTSSNGMSATTDAATVTVSAPAPSDARPMNVSTRALCLTGDDVLIPGFVVEGTGNKRLLMRAVGPELGPMGLPTFLPDPQMRLEQRQPDQSWLTLGQNDDWGANANAADIAPQAALLGAFPLDPGSTSAALLMDVPAGIYTIVAGGKGADTGVAIVELYDADSSSATTRLVNISNRGYVGTGNDIMIPGFVVSEQGPKTFLVRAVGPTLHQWLTGELSDPMIQIYGSPAPGREAPLLLTNDTWGENGDAAAIRAAATTVGAFPLDEGSADAAFIVTLPPGAYTVHARGVGGTTGIALVEVYLVP